MALPDLYDLTADNAVVDAGTTRYTADGEVYLPWVFDPASLRNPGTTLYEIPVRNPPCVFSFEFPEQACRLRFAYEDGEGTWIMDVSNDDDTPIVHGIPLVTGLDLLGPYASLGLGARLFVLSAGDPSDIPAFADLGTSARLYAEIAA